jgi:hypothetical protein
MAGYARRSNSRGHAGVTAKRRLVPLAEIEAALTLFERRGIDLSQWAVDIGPDYVRLTPPANSNAGDSLAQYINRSAHSPQTDKKR